jgi:hypothetical protein
VSQLGGEPQVTEEGDIIYVFPDMQLSATESSSALEKAGLKPDATARESQRELQLAGCTWGIGERRTFTNSKPVTFEYG